MKLRRAMAAAAATAVIAPLALLSAPAAFAEGTPSGSPSSSAPASTPASTPSSSASAVTTPSSAPASSSATALSQASKAPASASASVSQSPSQPALPSAQPTPCTADDRQVDPNSKLTMTVSGLPGKIVAGSGWHTFKLTAANHSDQSLGQVRWLAVIDNDSMSENYKDWLITYARLEYFNPQSKKWESVADKFGNGVYFGETPLGPEQTVDIQLRVDITAKAPAGDAFSLGFGSYFDPEKICERTSFDSYEFTVLQPGSSNDNPGQAKPGKNHTAPVGGKEPQGGVKEIPPTGSLASTGSSSALPVIGLVGGAAVVAGAGALIIVRRRKAGTQA